MRGKYVLERRQQRFDRCRSVIRGSALLIFLEILDAGLRSGSSRGLKRQSVLQGGTFKAFDPAGNENLMRDML